MPQQEPGWSRVRPLAPGPAGGNKMFPAGHAGWEEPRPCHRHRVRPQPPRAPAPALGSHGVCGDTAPVPWDVVFPWPGSLSFPCVPNGSRASPCWGPSAAEAAALLGFVGDVYGVYPGSEAPGSLPRERVIPGQRPRPRRRGLCNGRPAPRGVGRGLGRSAFARGSLPFLKVLQQVKY